MTALNLLRLGAKMGELWFSLPLVYLGGHFKVISIPVSPFLLGSHMENFRECPLRYVEEPASGNKITEMCRL